MRKQKPVFVKNNEVGRGRFKYEGKIFYYSILQKELETRLPGFLGFIEGKFLFISEEVPREFRVPQLIHEVIEFTELKGKEGRCLEALKMELLLVPEKIYSEYIKYRLNFFKALVDFYKNSDDEEFKREILASYEHLNSL